MKHLYSICTACLVMVCLLGNQQGIAQDQVQLPTHTPRSIMINSNIGGFYEYLPAGYNAAGSQRYPLIVYLHGDGDRGDGSQAELPRLLTKALPKYIDDGLFPVSVTVNGQTHRFLVISPQYDEWPSTVDIGAVITYAKNHYKVDTNRIYLTGMSVGGGRTWEYAGSSLLAAQKLAAIVPVCGYSTATSAATRNMANANLPVWATHNQGDPNVSVTLTNNYVSMINGNSTPPTPLAQKSIFAVADHDAWTQTYNPAWKENNRNIYEWMLQYSREELTLPVTLTNYRIISSDAAAVTIGWSTTMEQQNQYFSIERSTDGINFTVIGKVAATNLASGSNYIFKDGQPARGNNYYRLSQTDLNSKTTYYSLLKTTIDIDKGSLVLFPNPATTAVTVGFQHPDKDRLTVKIINQQGMVVQVNQYNKETGYWQQSIPTGQLAAGQYYIQVKGTVIENTQPLVIRK